MLRAGLYPVTRIARHAEPRAGVALRCIQHAGHPEWHWEMMMMLGPEGAQLPGVTPAGAETATGGPRPVPPSRPASLQIRHKITPRGTHIEGREKEMERKHIWICANCRGGSLIKDAVTSCDMPALSYLVPCLRAEIGVQGGREEFSVNINTWHRVVWCIGTDSLV